MTDHTPELCPQCDGTGYHLMKMRAMVGLGQYRVHMPNANTVILGAPVPPCPCDCHEEQAHAAV